MSQNNLIRYGRFNIFLISVDGVNYIQLQPLRKITTKLIKYFYISTYFLSTQLNTALLTTQLSHRICISRAGHRRQPEAERVQGGINGFWQCQISPNAVSTCVSVCAPMRSTETDTNIDTQTHHQDQPLWKSPALYRCNGLQNVDGNNWSATRMRFGTDFVQIVVLIKQGY